MAVLTIGRVGLDPVTVDDPTGIRVRSRRGSRIVTIAGDLAAASLADTLALRDELAATVDATKSVPVTWTGDSRLDGFWIPRAAAMSVESLQASGWVPFDMDLEFVGTSADVQMQSVITAAVRSNAHGVDASEAEFWLALPTGWDQFDDGQVAPTFLTRSGVDAVTVVRDVATSTHPTWGIAPANALKGAATIKVSGYVRAGLSCPNSPDNWELSNGLVRVTPNGTSLRWDVATHDGTQWDSAKTWRLFVGGSEITGSWSAISILRNDPEACAIRLVRRTLTFDFLLRRGSRYVELIVTRYAQAASMKVVKATAEAGTSITPTGATSAVAVRATSNDADGNRYVLGSALAHTQDLTNGGITWSNITTVDCFIGAEVGGLSAASGDTAADLALQYLGWVGERVVAVRR